MRRMKNTISVKTVVITIAAFASGFASHFLVNPRFGATFAVAEHWKLIEEYLAYLRDAPKRGYITTPPSDPLPSLAALVGAGELEHIDMVFPLVPASKQVNQILFGYVDSRDDIIFATSNPSYAAFQPLGQQALHLNIWFKESAKSDIQQLFRELESRYKRKGWNWKDETYHLVEEDMGSRIKSANSSFAPD